MAFSFVLLFWYFSIKLRVPSLSLCHPRSIGLVWPTQEAYIHPVRTLSNDLLNIHELCWRHRCIQASNAPRTGRPGSGQAMTGQWQWCGKAVSFQAITAVLPTCYAVNCYDLITVDIF